MVPRPRRTVPHAPLCGVPRAVPWRSTIAKIRLDSALLRLVVPLGAALAVFAAAHAASSTVGWWLVAAVEGDEPPVPVLQLLKPDSRKARRSVPGAKTRGSRTRTELGERILAHNLFCPSCREETAAEAPASTDGRVATLSATSLPLTLVATMEATDPGISLATIQTDVRVGLFAENELVMDGVQVVDIGPGVVTLNHRGRYELLHLGAEPPATKPKEAKPKKKKKRKKSKYELDGARDAIDCSGLNCTVDAGFLAGLVQNPSQLMRQGRARPYKKDGLSGMRLSRVRKGTLPRLLGLKSGDVVHSINGLAMDSMDGAMKAYQQLRSARSLSVSFTRNVKGKREQMELDVQVQ